MTRGKGLDFRMILPQPLIAYSGCFGAYFCCPEFNNSILSLFQYLKVSILDHLGNLWTTIELISEVGSVLGFPSVWKKTEQTTEDKTTGNYFQHHYIYIMQLDMFKV